MLIAYDIDDNIYFASNILDKKDYFYKCPACGEDVFLKYGNVKVPHFVHYNNVDHEWESESYEHRLMKLDVYDYFKEFFWVNNIELEKPIFINSDININKDENEDIIRNFLIPDIYIETNNGDKIAIECQCSIYSEDKINEKTNIYSRNGIYVIWIFHRKFTKKFSNGYKYLNIVPLNEVNSDLTSFNNIFYRKYYIYNDYKSINIKYNNNIELFINRIVNKLKELDIKDNDKNDDNCIVVDLHKHNVSINIMRGISNECNKYFKLKRMQYSSIIDGNRFTVIHDNQFKYFKNYNIIFSYVNMYLKDVNNINDNVNSNNDESDNNNEKFLKSAFIKKVDFEIYDKLKLNEKLFIIDSYLLNMQTIISKLEGKYDVDKILDNNFLSSTLKKHGDLF